MKFEHIKEQAKSEWEKFVSDETPLIMIGSGTCGRAAGAMEVFKSFQDELSNRELSDKIQLVEVGCLGLCYKEPLVEVKGKHGDRILYHSVKPNMIPNIIDTHLVKGEPFSDQVLAIVKGDQIEGIPSFDDLSMINKQVRIATRNCGHIDPTNFYHYVARGGYSSLLKVFEMDPEEVISVVENSALRGRGGAGFPTGTKWRSCRGYAGDIRYVICNGDEGDPGAFMDRSIMEGDPHSVIEGMIISAWAVGKDRSDVEGYIYVRAEYPLAVKNLNRAIEDANKYGLLGKNIQGTGFNFNITISQGAGAFVCGESSALMRSLEGKAGEPRVKYIRSVEQGLWNKPTNLNNVETYANVPAIIEKGSEWFNNVGAEGNGGTKVFSLSGKVKNTGSVEVAMGTKIRDVVFDIGGGILNDKSFKALQIGGPSGGCIPESLLDLPLTYESLSNVGSMMGSGGMIILDNETCMVDMAKYFIHFCTEESCGKCIPCREGTKNMLSILNKISNGEGVIEDIENIERLASSIAATSLCGLGQSAPNPVLSNLRYFRDEFEAHIHDKKCPAGVCKELITYFVDPDACTGCGVCMRNCPAEAISGEKKKAHSIDHEKCAKCGVCRQECKFDAVVAK